MNMIERGKLDPRDVRIADSNKAREKVLGERDHLVQIEREARELAIIEQAAREKTNRDRFAYRNQEAQKADAPKIDAVHSRIEKIFADQGRLVDSRRRDFPAPPAQAGGQERPMKKEVDDSDDWVRKARESVKISQPAPPKKKKLFGLFG